ncbi:MAG: hypothetical protein HOH61_11785, partial [Rhodospirillaceae bacterium]|nr:hypothetical protein [Rhodospirillaceae bacterium]
RRKKTRAPELFAHLDVLDEPLSHSGGELAGLGQSYGTNTRLTKKYNSAPRAERNRIIGETTNAFDWAKTATPAQKNAQMEAVKKAEVYDVTDNQYLYDQSFPNDPDTPAFIPNAGLTDQEDRDYFKGTPEQKQAIIEDLNAQIAPWPTYEPTLDEMGLGPKDDYGYVAPVEAVEAVDVKGDASANKATEDTETEPSASDILTIRRTDKSDDWREGKSNYDQVAADQHANFMNDAGEQTDKNSSDPSPVKAGSSRDPSNDAKNRAWEQSHKYVPPSQAKMDAVIAWIERIFPTKNDFMRKIAIHESHLGQHEDTARPGYYGGVFQVDEGTFRETQIRKGLAEQRAKVSAKLGRDWNTVTWRELRDNPLLSAIAARLSLLRWKKNIPADIEGQAAYWKKYYNTDEGWGSEEKFKNSVNAHQEKAKRRARSNPPMS